MPQWTGDQLKVIRSQKRRVVCSAAAGSGKTAVMVERILRMIREGADPLTFLIITFTNTAAFEMKEKIRKRLYEERKDPAVENALNKIDMMEISTIHAFCQRLIRQEFPTVGADPFFSICDAAQRTKLFSSAFRKACRVLKDRNDPDFAVFRKEYEPAQSEEMVTELYHFMMSLPDPFDWLREKTEDLPAEVNADHPWFRTAGVIVREKLAMAELLLRRQERMFDLYEKVDKYREVYKADSEKLAAVKNWLAGGIVSRETLESDFSRLPSVRGMNNLESDWSERYKALRKQLKERYAELLDFILIDPEKTGREFTAMRAALRGLAKLTEETAGWFEKKKNRLRVMDFSDLEHKALRILRDEFVRESVRARYSRIFVDECQDVSSVQDAIIQAVAGEKNGLFMVGDVKQSIYRFRLANPDLFLERTHRTEEEKGEDEDVIFLQENFRSRPEILETTNTVFRDVMRKTVSELDYNPEDELKAGRTDTPGYEPVRVDLIEPPADRTKLEALADHTALRIRELKEENRFKYRDMVILMPAVSTHGKELADLLGERGVPVFFDGGAEYFSLPEVIAFRNLLAYLDYPRQDVPLISSLKNAPFHFTDEELSAVRLSCGDMKSPYWKVFRETAKKDSAIGERCRKALEKLDRWSALSRVKPLGEFLWFLLFDSLHYAYSGAGPKGRAAQANLRRLCFQGEKAAEAGIHTLRAFLTYMADQSAGGDMKAASPLAEGDDVVRLMTIHKSKGLQFPVVFCLGLDRSPGGGNAAPGIRMDPQLGVCLKYKNPDLRLARRTVADKIFDWKKEREENAEKIRLLYVAMTRAQERLYLVGFNEEGEAWHMAKGDHRILAAKNYLDWIMPALYDAEKLSTYCSQPSKPWEITVCENDQQIIVDKPEDIHSLDEWLDSLLLHPPVDELWKNGPEAGEEKEAAGELPKKSVTELLRRAEIDLLEDGETPGTKREPEALRKALTRFRTPARPRFLDAKTVPDGALRGTVNHRFLSLVDLDAVRNSADRAETLRAELERMTEKRIFSKEESGWIRLEDIACFFDTPVGQRMLASDEVHREWDFNLFVRERGMIVQGVVDCIFREEGGWVILDYKTDRVTDEKAFKEEYAPQLAWYRRAIGELTGIPVPECWLYSFALGREVQVEMPPAG